jgi:DNA-binding transcriptional MerR regulator
MLTTKQLAERWSISARTLETWRQQGTGPAFIKIGNLVRYRIEDIEIFERKE